MITRARVLLALDETPGPAPDRRLVAERVGASESTVYLVAKEFTTHAGRVEEVIIRKKRATPPVEPADTTAIMCPMSPRGLGSSDSIETQPVEQSKVSARRGVHPQVSGGSVRTRSG